MGNVGHPEKGWLLCDLEAVPAEEIEVIAAWFDLGNHAEVGWHPATKTYGSYSRGAWLRTGYESITAASRDIDLVIAEYALKALRILREHRT